MSKGPHPSHDLEWRDSSHYDYVCRKCDTADTPSGWGKLAEPCSADKKEYDDTVEIGTNPLPKDAQEKLAEFLDWLDVHYETEHGSTALYWELSYTLRQRIKQKGQQ